MIQFANLDELYDYWRITKLPFNSGLRLIANFYHVRPATAEKIWILLHRLPRKSPEFIDRIVKADKIADFDWSCIFSHTEKKELKRVGL